MSDDGNNKNGKQQDGMKNKTSKLQDGIKIVRVGDSNYPKRLLPYKDKPKQLYYKGKLPDNNKPTVALIGARACSNYGRQIAKQIGKTLAENGVQIISGMARGIDTYSQLGAIEGNGSTFGILGCGVDICYPTENIELYEEIQGKGGIISEYPPGDKPLNWHFPQRNRIISGLSDAIIVVEAKENSGSLITVEWALEQGKDVWAVPGRIGEGLSLGCNRLIKAGAGIITDTKNIIEEIFPDYKYVVFKEGQEEEANKKPLEKDFSLLYSELSLQPKSVYELMEDTGLTLEVILNGLLQLQLMGLAEQSISNYYTRCK